jgi:putative transposase
LPPSGPLRIAFSRSYGPEFLGQHFVDWCTAHGTAVHHIQPGKLDQNAYIERFNPTYRSEVLNAHLFASLEELQALTDTWLRIYNEERPHDSLGRVTPLPYLPRPSAESPNAVSACRGSFRCRSPTLQCGQPYAA